MTLVVVSFIKNVTISDNKRGGNLGIRLGSCLTPYQRLRLYNGAPFSRLLRHAGDTEDVFST